MFKLPDNVSGKASFCLCGLTVAFLECLDYIALVHSDKILLSKKHMSVVAFDLRRLTFCLRNDVFF